jgi:tRNA (guanine10-N2)-dimethyltransferase
LLDPFCGTGVILQEAALMGFRVYGTDIEPRMIDYTRENLGWVSRKFGREFREISAERDFARKLETVSATEAKWDFEGKFPDFVAGETYLGRAYASEPSAENLRENIGNVNKILTEFLRNLRNQADEKTGICLAVPAWFVHGKTLHLPLLKDLESLGFLRSSFGSFADEKYRQTFPGLVYHRENQIVGRELLVLRKISRK